MKRPATKRLAASVFVAALIGTSAMLAQSQRSWFKAKDPGPRPNPASAIPVPVAGLNDNETALFNESLLRVSELEGSCDTCSQQPQNTLPTDPDPNNPFSPTSLVNSAGMSPVFNADQCFTCHSQPAIGGSSPAHNPADKIAHRLGGTNTVPQFEAPDGAFREVRFKYHADGTRDGGVHSLFTLQGRSDAPVRLAIAVGNEGAGISGELRAKAQRTVSLPIASGVESLNVAVATGIILYELRS